MTPAALKALAEGNVENFVAATTPGGIEAQEHHGQMKFASSSTLPKEMNGCTREQLERMGIVFGKDADDLFVNVTLPKGWRIRPTLHSMWLHLVDDKGRKRAAMFYKAAFYDRSAHIGLCRRFSVEGYESCNQNGEPVDEGVRPQWFKTVVKDGDTVIHVVGIRKHDSHDLREEHYRFGKQWLAEHFPQWEDVLAYWA